jgi:hypothetical protein
MMYQGKNSKRTSLGNLLDHGLLFGGSVLGLFHIRIDIPDETDDREDTTTPSMISLYSFTRLVTSFA